MIDINKSFVTAHLIGHLDPMKEGEVNPIQHSNYYNNEEFMKTHTQIHRKLCI